MGLRRRGGVIALLLALTCSQSPYEAREFVVMGTVGRVVVPAERGDLIDTAITRFRLVDSLMSGWHESEITGLRGGWNKVSPPTARCIELSLKAAKRTGGLFDPTIGVLTRAWGFKSQNPQRPKGVNYDSLKALVNWRLVKVEGDSVFLAPGQKLDLGGIAKGFALGLAARRLRELGCDTFLLDLGGDIVCSGKSWKIGIRNPDGGLFGVIEVKDAAVFTSGDYERYAKEGDTLYPHIFNPAEGQPSDPVRSVTVIGQDPALTDAFATALFLRPEPAFAESLGVEALWIGRGGKIWKTRRFPKVARAR